MRSKAPAGPRPAFEGRPGGQRHEVLDVREPVGEEKVGTEVTRHRARHQESSPPAAEPGGQGAGGGGQPG